MSNLDRTKVQYWFTKVKDKDETPMGWLYRQLAGIYAGKWRSSFPDEQAVSDWMSVWAESFVESKLTPIMVHRGVKNCKTIFKDEKDDWPPSLAKFLHLCKQPENDALTEPLVKPLQLENKRTPEQKQRDIERIRGLQEMLDKSAAKQARGPYDGR